MSTIATKKPAASAPDAPYSYRCSIPNASVGMEVIAPTAKREARAVICEIDVPESRIDKRILPLLKEITQEAPADGE